MKQYHFGLKKTNTQFSHNKSAEEKLCRAQSKILGLLIQYAIELHISLKTFI